MINGDLGEMIVHGRPDSTKAQRAVQTETTKFKTIVSEVHLMPEKLPRYCPSRFCFNSNGPGHQNK
jgi:hypothetical protein